MAVGEVQGGLHSIPLGGGATEDVDGAGDVD